ncbi:DsbA family protein [Synechococcus sp. R55.6]|jgi:protein-disulfide isomerase|nr:DsbA family protein [Cyanobacteriota bacterium PSP.bin.10]
MHRLVRIFRAWGRSLARAGLLFGLTVLLGVGSGAPVFLPAAAAAPADLEEQVLQIIRKNPQVILEAVQEYQQRQYQEQQQQQQRLAEEFGRQLRENPRAVIGDSPRLGSDALRLVLVEFSDFQCPFCARAHSTLKQFMADHGDEVTLVYKHLPLTSIHPEAMSAARAAWAAQRQGKFWEFHDELFANQSQLGDGFYVATAEKLGLNIEKFNRDRRSRAAERAIQRDIDLASQLGIGGTPHFILNGIAFSGAQPLEVFEQTLQQAKQAL